MKNSRIMDNSLCNIMDLTINVMGSYERGFALSNDESIINRAYAVDWMKKVLLQGCPEARDTAVQVFNKYLILCYVENKSILKDTVFLSYAAAASLTIAVKLHTSNKILNLCRGPSRFDASEVARFEREILNRISFQIYPTCTPSSFVESIVNMNQSSFTNIDLLLSTCDTMIGEFCEEPDYLLFAPSAIAISALLISFSVLHMPCTSWLKTIPDICLPNNTSSIYPNNSKESRFLDIDRCICCFKKIPFLQSRSKNRSPTSVTEMFETSSDSPSSA